MTRAFPCRALPAPVAFDPLILCFPISAGLLRLEMRHLPRKDTFRPDWLKPAQKRPGSKVGCREAGRQIILANFFILNLNVLNLLLFFYNFAVVKERRRCDRVPDFAERRARHHRPRLAHRPAGETKQRLVADRAPDRAAIRQIGASMVKSTRSPAHPGQSRHRAATLGAGAATWPGRCRTRGALACL